MWSQRCDNAVAQWPDGLPAGEVHPRHPESCSGEQQCVLPCFGYRRSWRGLGYRPGCEVLMGAVGRRIT